MIEKTGLLIWQLFQMIFDGTVSSQVLHPVWNIIPPNFSYSRRVVNFSFLDEFRIPNLSSKGFICFVAKNYLKATITSEILKSFYKFYPLYFDLYLVVFIFLITVLLMVLLLLLLTLLSVQLLLSWSQISLTLCFTNLVYEKNYFFVSYFFLC